MKFLFLFVNIAFLLKLRADVFSSVFQMKNLIETEGQIIKSLENYIAIENNANKGFTTIDKYLKRSKEEHEKALRDPEKYLGNPINAYTLIKRQTLDLDYVEQLIGDFTTYSRNDSVYYPTLEDLDGAIVGLLRIQTLYQLEVTQLANGTLVGKISRNKTPFIEYVTPMSISDCYELGRTNYSDNDYKRNLPWLLAALQKHKDSEYDVSDVTEYDILYHIAFMYTVTYDQINSWKWRKKLLDKFRELKHSEIPYLHVYSMLDEIYNMTEKGTIEIDRVKKSKYFTQVSIYSPKVSQVCRGESGVVNVISRSCAYAYKQHPFLTLARIKVEYLNFEPLVMLFHDVISDSEIHVLQQITIPKMMRNEIVNFNTKTGELLPSTKSPTRVSQGAFLSYNSSEVLVKISRRSEHFTGLHIKNSENLIVMNYGIGGHYATHYDYYKDENIKKYHNRTGNRIATLLFYLSDVEQGGATVFPILNLTVFPIKGSALFWYNLLPNGTGNPYTMHAACPVLRGSKWVANRFISAAGQKLTNSVATSG